MSDVTLPNTIQAGQQRSAAKIQQNDEALRDHINGDGWIDTSKYGAGSVDAAALADAAKLGLSQSGAVRRGKSITATEQSRTNTAYGPLSGTSGVDATDEVRDIVLPTDGLLFIAYQALWKESVRGAASAAIFLGSDQLKVRTGGAPSPTQPAATIAENGGGSANFYTGLSSFQLGLVSLDDQTPAGSDATTGQVVGLGERPVFELLTGGNAIPVVGGICCVFAAAGTYDVSVRFKASSGSVVAKERKLWSWAMGF